MTFSPRIKSLEAAIKRLEDAAGKGRKHCAYCQFMMSPLVPGQNQRKPCPEEPVNARCEFCYSRYIINLASFPEDEREAWRLYYSFTMKDQYTNPKAYALQIWVGIRHDPKKAQGDSINPTGKVNNQDSQAHYMLLDELCKLSERKRNMLRAKYGVHPFPEITQLMKSVKDRDRSNRKTNTFVEGLSELDEEETRLLMSAEMEKIIWGEVRPDTAAAIKRVEREINGLMKTSVEANERRNGESGRNSSWFLKRRRAVRTAHFPYNHGKNG